MSSCRETTLSATTKSAILVTNEGGREEGREGEREGGRRGVGRRGLDLWLLYNY